MVCLTTSDVAVASGTFEDGIKFQAEQVEKKQKTRIIDMECANLKNLIQAKHDLLRGHIKIVWQCARLNWINCRLAGVSGNLRNAIAVPEVGFHE